MAGKRLKSTGKWEFVVKRAGVLDKPLYFTFDTVEEGEAYCGRLEKLLDKGIVPGEFTAPARVLTIRDLVREYTRDAHPSDKDRAALGTIERAVGTEPLQDINAAWVDNWVATMKRVDRVKPGTIRSKVGALARCADWGVRKGLLVLPDHPFRTLPSGYANYTEADAALAGEAQEDNERDRRLEPGEWERIMAVIDAGVLPRKQRPYALPDPAGLRCLLILAVESAMRLREMYTLDVSQVRLDQRTVFLDKTKNGDKRQVPLSTVAVAALKDYMPSKGQVFPWWDGQHTRHSRHKATDFLSKLFVNIFRQAECEDLLLHDLRHEAVSRLYERTQLTDLQISKISGHRSLVVLRRYSNLRGSDLAGAMW